MAALAPILVLLCSFPLFAQRTVTVRLLYNHPDHPDSKTVTLPLEEYVTGVLAGEANTFQSAEAMKAMAVAIRTFAVKHRGRHRDEGFDFCDTTHCQDLRLEAVTPRVRMAAEATAGELLWFEGELAATYYHRHCGGTTEDAAQVWPEAAAPYLKQQPDTFCTTHGRAEWNAPIGRDELHRALAGAGLQLPQPPRRVEVTERSPSGRALTVAVDGRPVRATAFHRVIGQALGWHLLRGTLYDVTARGEEFVFHGYGEGHGVGLCQTGADERGKAGQDYRRILAFYYPGTAIGLTASGFRWRLLGGERVDLFTTEPGRDGRVVALADRLLHEAERRAGFGYDRRPRVRLYPTLDAFRNATGEPGSVAAVTSGGTVHMQPAGLLESRGVLESTLLHEFLHLLVESRAHPSLPWWFREGLVLYLAEPERPAAGDAATAGARDRGSYEAARSRVKRLAEAHGRAQLAAWLTGGLPGGLGLDR